MFEAILDFAGHGTEAKFEVTGYTSSKFDPHCFIRLTDYPRHEQRLQSSNGSRPGSILLVECIG